MAGSGSEATPEPSAAPPGVAIPPPLAVEVVTDLDTLEARAPAWNALTASVPFPHVPATHAWFATHVEHKVAPPATWRCVLAWEEGRLAGVLPVVSTRDPRRALHGWRVPGEYLCPDGDAILATGREAAVFDALLGGLERTDRRWGFLRLGALRPGGATRAALAAGTRLGVATVEEDAYGARVPLAGGREAWWRGVGENLRVNLRKARNRLERAHPGAVAYRFFEGPAATPDLLGTFAALEARGWKGADGGALAASPAKLAFYGSLGRRLAAGGLLEWHLLEVDGRPAAMHLAARLGRTLALLRICYDEALARFMPGNLLIRAAIERAIERGDTETVDFVQAQPWQAHWRMETYRYGRAVLRARRPLPFLLGTLPARMRGLARRILRGPAARAEGNPLHSQRVVEG